MYASQGTLNVQATHPRIINPVVLTPPAVYEVRNLTNPECGYLCNAVPDASYRHKGDGWTRVSVPTRAEQELVRHLNDNGLFYVKLL